MANLRYVVVDVFTDRPLTGNQLAVFTDARGLPSETMQALAREMNYSESVFVQRPEAGGHARLRIFTPTRELSFAGHPVLGTAFVLAGPLQTGELRLETGAGVIEVVLDRDDARIKFGWMRQPIATVHSVPEPAAMLRALGVPASQLPIERYDLGPGHAFVSVGSREEVAQLRPDFAALSELDDIGYSVFCAEGTRAKTRTFAPRHGVNEDAATGSAAGPLAMHLVRHGKLGSGEMLTIEQGEEIGRPSKLYARVIGDREHIEAVEVGGKALIVARGEFVVPFTRRPS